MVCWFHFFTMVIKTRIELLLLMRLVSVSIGLWQQNLKFSFNQQTVEFGPTHIFTFYAPPTATTGTTTTAAV